MSVQISIEKACLALCHWVTFSEICFPDYHINEGAVVNKYASLLSCIDRVNDLRLTQEKRYSSIGVLLNFEPVFPEGVKDSAGDLFFHSDKTQLNNNPLGYLIEVKTAHNKQYKYTPSFPGEIVEDLEKLGYMINGLRTSQIRCFVLYLAQNCKVNLALVNDVKGNNEKLPVARRYRAKRSFPKINQDLGNGLEVHLRSFKKSFSTNDRTRGDFCYLFELVYDRGTE